MNQRRRRNVSDQEGGTPISGPAGLAPRYASVGFIKVYLHSHKLYLFHAIWKPRAVCRLHAMQSADCTATVSMNYMHVCALER